MAKEVAFGTEFRQRILIGVELLANTVAVTMGPRGRTVGWQQSQGAPLLLSGGSAEAWNLQSDEPGAALGIELLRKTCMETHRAAGDGAATTAVLARYLLREGLHNVAAGADPLALKRGIQEASQLGAAALRRIAQPVADLTRLATMVAGDDAVGQTLACALEQAGTSGVITIVPSQTGDTSTNWRVGLHYEKGWISSEMATDASKTVCELSNPRILITDQTIDSAHVIAPLLEQAAAVDTPLVIIAEAVKGDALATLLLNLRRGAVRAAVAHPPAYGNGRTARLEDLAIAVGGTFFSEQLGYSLRDIAWDALGRAASVRMDRHNTIVTGGDGSREAVACRIQSLRTMLARTEYDFDRKQLEERIAWLSSGVAEVRIGGTTESEIQGKVRRANAALQATKSALAHGIVPGGGTGYLRILPALAAYVHDAEGDVAIGGRILMRALEEPFRWISSNAGLNPDAEIASVKGGSGGLGLDVEAETVVDLLQAGIVDPVQTMALALQNAASLAGTVLTAEAGIMLRN